MVGAGDGGVRLARAADFFSALSYVPILPARPCLEAASEDGYLFPESPSAFRSMAATIRRYVAAYAQSCRIMGLGAHQDAIGPP